eukprot:snap_masked-scaffold_12-processed-gene-5.67-mRNA-1 protein AED:0.01 eAED:0.01 QI:0/-1/0/1/-1/1/1/0/455
MSLRKLSSTSKNELRNLLSLDRNHVIHPYTSLTNTEAPLLIKSAERIYLNVQTEAGVIPLIDGMSSWWSAIHGYKNKYLDQAAKTQIDKFSHVMFGGLSHEPAIDLSSKLVEITPGKLLKVFLSDSGSVSVEVALKMAIQYHASRNGGSSKKVKFLTIRDGYHGDTFGDMSVCDPVNGMHSIFKGILPHQYFVESPSSLFSEPNNRAEAESLRQMEQVLKREGENIAAVVLEPLVQGAGGMKFYSENYLISVKMLCVKYGCLLVLDEIATGFGRTGSLFASEKVEADILCLGKALTGGYVSLGATLVTDEVCQGISDSFPDTSVFMHGPTFMGNPLSCAIANASVKYLLESPWQSRVSMVESILRSRLESLGDRFETKGVRARVKGAIGVVELPWSLQEKVGTDRQRDIMFTAGVWLRPFGKLVYTMPQFNAGMEEVEVEQICDGIEALVEEAFK